jgi:hypothetical protein
MPDLSSERALRVAAWGLGGWFVLILALHLAALTLGWGNLNLPGNEFRQAQTALSAVAIQQDGGFALAYPTPVLGKPWSVPFEFPLYQWSVVGLSNATGYPLVQSGRLVSAVCFYLALPAVWLLLARMGVGRSRRLIVLGLVLACPLHVFYSRAFLIETLALMFSLWFLQAFVAALEGRRLAWLLVANVAGAGAGIVKVTTFAAVLGPAAAWAAWRLWAMRPRSGAGARPDCGGWRSVARELAWLLALVALPLWATVWWVHFADAVKALNPNAHFALSANLRFFNFSNLQERLDAGLWMHQGAHLLRGVAGPAVLLLGALALLLARRFRGWALAALGAFLVPPLVFPKLYEIHEYYFMANAVFLLVALGLAVAALFDQPRRRWLAVVLLAVLPALQAWSYCASYRQAQAQPSNGGDQLSQMLRRVTAPGEVLVVAGQDWNAMTPYYAQRRALLIRNGSTQDWPLVESSFAALEGETVGALLLCGEQRYNAGLRSRAVQRFGLDPRPLFALGDTEVLVPSEVRPSALGFLHTVPLPELVLPPRAEADEDPLRGQVVRVAKLPALIRQHFREFSPAPVRSQSTFAYSSAEYEGRIFFSAHPYTRLWFTPPAARCHVSGSFVIYEGAYKDRKPGECTDGVLFALVELRADGTRRTLFERLLDPMGKEADRGLQKLELEVTTAPGSELLFEATPGPAGNWSFDWAALGPLSIRPVE